MLCYSNGTDKRAQGSVVVLGETWRQWLYTAKTPHRTGKNDVNGDGHLADHTRGSYVHRCSLDVTQRDVTVHRFTVHTTYSSPIMTERRSVFSACATKSAPKLLKLLQTAELSIRCRRRSRDNSLANLWDSDTVQWRSAACQPEFATLHA